MARTTFGEFIAPADGLATWVAGEGVVPQTPYGISYKSDGTVEGSVKFRCEASNRGNLPKIGDPHPLDVNATCHDVNISIVGNGIAEATCSYHGISDEAGDETRATIEYPGGVDQVPITAHPDFTLLAGTSDEPNNGSRWVDPDTRKVSFEANAEFEGFVDPGFPDHFAMEVFFQARPIINRTRWSRRPPTLKKSCTIVDSVPGFTNPPGIVNWLLLDTPFQQVGKASFRITEQYKGSPAPGWFKDVYPD